MTQYHKKAGSQSKVTGQKRVFPGFEAREVADTLCTNTPHGKHALTPFLLLGGVAYVVPARVTPAVIEESAAVGRALGIPLPEDCVDQHWALVSGLDPSARGSMSHDLEAGRRLELEALNGAVVRLGRQLRILPP